MREWLSERERLAAETRAQALLDRLENTLDEGLQRLFAHDEEFNDTQARRVKHKLDEMAGELDAMTA